MIPIQTPVSVGRPVKTRSTGFMLRSCTKPNVGFSIDEYLKMDRSGLFGNDRVELVLGRIYKMHAQANPHRWCISKGNRLLPPLFPPATHWLVGQGTLFLGRRGAPEPDFHLFDVPEGTVDARLPLPVWVVEISDTTYRRDSGPKLRQYAAAGIGEYWIVNIEEQRIEVYRRPVRDSSRPRSWTYGDVEHVARGSSITLLACPTIHIAVADLLP